MSEMVAICTDCAAEFGVADGWLDRCAECCAVRDDHLSGLHTAYAKGCTDCDRADDAPRAGVHAA
ncbi:hypothetical protein KV100_09505 [Mumia sp. zg.B21]|nr:hypothetical protein [Mumia sp. zg.B21]MBW9209896.1 hypothetical protein [Mumia sp. zg.B21]